MSSLLSSAPKTTTLWLYFCSVVFLCHGATESNYVWLNRGPLLEERLRYYEESASFVYKQIAGHLPTGITQCAYNSNAEIANIFNALPRPSVDFRFVQGCLTSEISFFANNKEQALASYIGFSKIHAQEAVYDARYKRAIELWNSEKTQGINRVFNDYFKSRVPRSEVVRCAEKFYGLFLKLDRKLFSDWVCIYGSEKWTVYCVALIDGYKVPSCRVVFEFADSDEMTLLNAAINTTELPKVRNTLVKLSGSEAQNFGAEHLKMFYPKRQLNTLQFSTNYLEVIQPRLDFEHQGEDRVNTNALTLAWVVVFARRNNTLVTTPVYVYVDAKDGSMLGGSD